MRLAPSSIRTAVRATAVAALMVSTVLTAPARQASALPTSTLAAAGPLGGNSVYSGAYRCTLGFNVRDSSNAYYFLVSKRCGGSGAWYANSSHTVVLGATTASSASSDTDTALVRYADQTIARAGAVDLYNGASQDILTAAGAYVGEPVKRSGGTTGVHSGTVLAVNVTVVYAEATLIGLIKTNVCSETGDVGSPLFDGTTAIGLLVTSSGNCSSGGTSYYRPVTDPLAVYGVHVY